MRNHPGRGGREGRGLGRTVGIEEGSPGARREGECDERKLEGRESAVNGKSS